VTVRDAEIRPLPGDPATLATAAGAFSRAATALGTAQDDVARVRQAVADQRGPAVTRAVERLTGVEGRASTTAHVLEQAAHALRHYADVLALHQRDAQDAIDRREAALAEHRRWSAAAWTTTPTLLDLTDPTSPGPFRTDPFGPAAVDPSTARARLADANDDVRRAEADWRRARDAAEAEARRAASRLAPLGDVTTVGLWVASDRPAWSLHGSWDAGSRAAVVLDGLVAGGSSGAADAEARAAALDEVARLVAEGEDDDVFWSAFFAATTPEESYVLLAELGLAGDTATVHRVTQGFSIWTRAIDAEAQEELGRDMLSVTDLPGRFEAVPWAPYAALLLGAPLVPGRVYLGAARALDDGARRSLRVPGTGTAGPSAPYLSPGAQADPATDPVDAQLDVAIFRGLARSGPEALDFFAPSGDDELGRERVSRWVGAAPFTWGLDRGEALADALRAAAQEGAASVSPAQQERAAALVARVTTALPDGMLACPLSREAAVHLVNLYEPYLGAFDDAVYAEAPEDAAGGVVPETAVDLARVQYLALDVGPRGPMPVLDPFALREVVSGTASAHPDAAVRWGQLATSYQTRTLADVYLPESGIVPELAAQRTATDDVLRVAGVVYGGIQYAGLLEGESDATLQANLLTAAGTVADLVTAAVRPLTAVGVITGLTALANGALPDHVGDAVDRIVAAGGSYKELVASGNHELAVAVAVENGMAETEARAVYAPLSPDSKEATDAFQNAFDTMSGLDRGSDEPSG
jgi:hypothetical protein